MNSLQRLLNKFTVGDGCWEWTAGTDSEGYGRVWQDGKNRLAHRVVYELLVGPVPEGLELDHVKDLGCTIRHCVRPNHLEPVPHAVNVQRGDVAYINKTKTHCPKNHPYDDANTYWHNNKRQCRTCRKDRW